MPASGVELTVNEPPISFTRARILRRPDPEEGDWVSKPLPLSAIWSLSRAWSCWRLIRMSVAEAWRTLLLSPSRIRFMR